MAKSKMLAFTSKDLGAARVFVTTTKKEEETKQCLKDSCDIDLEKDYFRQELPGAYATLEVKAY